MATNEGWTRKEAAQHFRVSIHTIRGWHRNFKKWLHVSGEFTSGVNVPIHYDEHDMLVFRLVQEGTRAGRSFKEIKETLNDDLAIAPDFAPDKEQAQEESDETALVPWQQYSAVVAQLQGTEGRLVAIEDERNYLRERVDKIENSQEEERERLQTKIDELEEKLDDERKKSWFDKLRGR